MIPEFRIGDWVHVSINFRTGAGLHLNPAHPNGDGSILSDDPICHDFIGIVDTLQVLSHGND